EGEARVRGEDDDVRRASCTAGGGDHVGIARRSSGHWQKLKLELPGAGTCIRYGVGYSGINDPAVVNPVATTHDRLATPGEIPGKADARSKVLFVAGELGARWQCRKIRDLGVR